MTLDHLHRSGELFSERIFFAEMATRVRIAESFKTCFF